MNEIIGQPGAETLLARSIQCGRICHAYLFLGASGSGKATLYDPNTGITQIQEQSGTTESLTVHDPARFDLFHGTSANE